MEPCYFFPLEHLCLHLASFQKCQSVVLTFNRLLHFPLMQFSTEFSTSNVFLCLSMCFNVPLWTFMCSCWMPYQEIWKVEWRTFVKSSCRANTLVLPPPPKKTCSRYTPKLVVWTGSKLVVLSLEQFHMEHDQTMLIDGKIAPKGMPFKSKSEWYCTREHVLTWEGLSTQLRRAHVMTQGQPVNYSD